MTPNMAQRTIRTLDGFDREIRDTWAHECPVCWKIFRTAIGLKRTQPGIACPNPDCGGFQQTSTRQLGKGGF